MELIYSIVLHQIKRELGLTTLQYMMADSIYHLSHGGWCMASRPYFAGLFDINRSTVIRNLNILEELGLIERDAKTDYLRSTQTWKNTVVFREQTMLSTRTNDPSQNATPPSQNATGTRRKLRPYNEVLDKEKNIKDISSHNVGGDGKQIPPDRQSVEAYFLSKGKELGLTLNACDFEADKFWNYHVNCGWKMKGGKGVLMKNWQLAANTWMRNAVAWSKPKQEKKEQQKSGSNMTLFHDLMGGSNG